MRRWRLSTTPRRANGAGAGMLGMASKAATTVRRMRRGGKDPAFSVSKSKRSPPAPTPATPCARQLAKPGVDCLTWGPSDLSFDLEAHPEHPFKTVDDCLQHVLKQLQGTDIRISFRNYSSDLRNKYMDMGVTVFMERPR